MRLQLRLTDVVLWKYGKALSWAPSNHSSRRRSSSPSTFSRKHEENTRRAMKSKMQVVLAVCLLIFHGGCAAEEGKAEGEIEIVVESSEPEAVPFGADGLYPNPPPKPEGILVVVVEADYSENHPAPDCQKGIPKKTTRSQATHGWRNENVLSLVLLIVVCICTIFTIGLLGTFLHQHRSACSKNTSAPKDSSAPKATSVLHKGHLGKPIITTIPILKLTSSLKGDKKEEDLARLI